MNWMWVFDFAWESERGGVGRMISAVVSRDIYSLHCRIFPQKLKEKQCAGTDGDMLSPWCGNQRMNYNAGRAGGQGCSQGTKVPLRMRTEKSGDQGERLGA